MMRPTKPESEGMSQERFAQICKSGTKGLPKMGDTAKPRITIEYCTQCNWMLRAAWMAQELLQTFGQDIGEVALIPGTGGVFVVQSGGRRAKSSERTCVIVMKVDAYEGWTTGGHTWWEVGTPQVSASKLVVEAHQEWESSRSRQRKGV